MKQLLNHLRYATGRDHEMLEATLDLLAAPLSRERFCVALRGFYAFHLAWEPRVEGLIADAGFMAPRRKTALAVRDLAALGVTPDRGLRVDAGYVGELSQAWGSLYVMEGASLGGQVICKALRQAAWAPPDGLSYFNPYGRRTGAMWAAFCQRLAATSGRLDAEAAAGAAQATFAAVRDVITQAQISAAATEAA